MAVIRWLLTASEAQLLRFLVLGLLILILGAILPISAVNVFRHR
ncbi:hypothetical protein WQQ_41760 [Hydrocarboniphaga effusa AP103]|jgi:hypothetical protein|uniref:Uncharacterized protein n=1 Tax=Hydrocarboniphaga effusa AP103 TaxID=1172194 RepID=I8HWM0_9GAMM|nr:hypothetical protein WQQ_41760 [Hydrocarboniphaga effusa AP103]